jgi:hypothetical protein
MTEAKRTSVLAIVSLVVGVVGIILSCLFWPVGIVLAIVALVLGILGLNEVNKQPGVGGKPLAIVGIVLGGLGVLVAILAIAGLTALILLGPRIENIFRQIYSSLSQPW